MTGGEVCLACLAETVSGVDHEPACPGRPFPDVIQDALDASTAERPYEFYAGLKKSDLRTWLHSQKLSTNTRDTKDELIRQVCAWKVARMNRSERAVPGGEFFGFEGDQSRDELLRSQASLERKVAWLEKAAGMSEESREAVLQAILLEKSRLRRVIKKPSKRQTPWGQRKDNTLRRKRLKALDSAMEVLKLGEYDE